MMKDNSRLINKNQNLSEDVLEMCGDVKFTQETYETTDEAYENLILNI